MLLDVDGDDADMARGTVVVPWRGGPPAATLPTEVGPSSRGAGEKAVTTNGRMTTTHTNIAVKKTPFIGYPKRTEEMTVISQQRRLQKSFAYVHIYIWMLHSHTYDIHKCHIYICDTHNEEYGPRPVSFASFLLVTESFADPI